MKHPTRVIYYNGSLFKEAKDLSNLRYDKLAEFAEFMSHYLRVDAKNDLEGGRPILAKKLRKLSREWKRVSQTALVLEVKQKTQDKFFTLENPRYVGSLEKEARELTNLLYDRLEIFSVYLKYHLDNQDYKKISKRLERVIDETGKLWKSREGKC